MSNARKTLENMRQVRAAVAGCEMTCRIHSVRRVGDAGHAVISVDAIATLADGRRPTFRGRTMPASRRVRALGMSLGRGRMDSLNYWVDSSAHFWCADNAPNLYTGEQA